ncbi:MAG: hypothetical protein EXR33_04480 [Betaproteobacteria bacterium]|nr:hypothetical protein [Betaproteobacteria bacterium]
MVTLLQKNAFWVAVGIAAAAEGLVIYLQWPPPPLKVCASVELGELLAMATKTEAELREARARLELPGGRGLQGSHAHGGGVRSGLDRGCQIQAAGAGAAKGKRRGRARGIV